VSFLPSSLLRFSSILAAVSAIVLTTGCASMTTTAVDSSIQSGGSISGSAYGGRQPISGAAVTLWAAGNSGYGSAATSLATTTTAPDGTFSFGPGSGHTYTCPSSSSSTASQLLYLTTSGGQPTTGTTNSVAALFAALGDCLTVQSNNPSVVIDEVSTIAGMASLQQFFSPLAAGLGNIGATSTNITGLRNAFATVNNLVSLGSGLAISTVNLGGSISGINSPSVTVTPEQNKIDTMADILAACINTNGAITSGAACNTLFSNVSNATVKDTLQAAYYMVSNPTSTTSSTTSAACGTTASTTTNICTLFGLAASTPPYNPSLAAAPTDWSVGVTYGSNSYQVVAGTNVYLMTEPEWVAIDSLGNVWLANFSTTSATVPGNSVAELSPTGAPEAQVLTAAGNIAAPRNLVIDLANNVYVGSYGASGAGQQITEYSNLGVTKTFPLLKTGPDSMAIDGASNVYVATYGGTAGSGDLEVIPAGSATNTTAILQASSVSAGTYSSLAIDANFDLWLSNNANTATVQFICTATPCTATSTTVATAPQSIAIDHAGNVWIGNYSSTAGSVAEIAATSTAVINAAAGSPFSGGGLASPFRSLIDGLGNVWVTNYKSAAGTVSELSSAGAAISPGVGFAHTYAGAYGLAIDASGNVWIGNGSSGAAASSTAQGFITEIVGQAAPVVTPLAASLPGAAGGTSRLGIRP
jgi:hypothetical protein